MRIGVIGAGPAGCFFSHLTSSMGAEVFLFDHRAPKNKACGGGITARAVQEFPFLADLPCPRSEIKESLFISPYNLTCEVNLNSPLHIFPRLELNKALLDMATASGADFIKQKVVDFYETAAGWKIQAAKTSYQVDLLIGADGATGLSRGKLIGKLPRSFTLIGMGYYLDNFTGKSIIIKLMPDFPGYIWIFPGPEYATIGLALPQGVLNSRGILGKLEEFTEEHFPAVNLRNGRVFAGLIPSFRDPSLLKQRFLGRNWALIGDAASLVDPITGEGIYYALKSAHFLATTLARKELSKTSGQVIQKKVLKELATASRFTRWFFNPGFTHKMLELASHHSGINRVLANLIEGNQGFTTLKRRLIREKFSTLFDLIRFSYFR